MAAEWSAIPIEESKQLITAICRPWMWRLANGFMVIFFALAAFVQINDPDPVIWMLVYTVPCILCFVVIIDTSLQDHFLWKSFAMTHLGACIVGVVYLLSVLSRTHSGSYNPLNTEEGREAAGLLVVIFWLFLCQLTRVKRFSEASAYLWTATIAVSLVPFVLSGYYVMTWDLSSLQSHCKDIISKHLS